MVDELRLILLGIGLLVIVGIYLWGMRARIRESIANRRRRAQAMAPENEPLLDASEVDQPEADVWSEPEIRVIRPARSDNSAWRSAPEAPETPASADGPQPSGDESSGDAGTERPKSLEGTAEDAAKPTEAEPDRAGVSARAEPVDADVSGDASGDEDQPAETPTESKKPPVAPVGSASGAQTPRQLAEPRARPELESRREPREAAGPQKTVLLTVIAPKGQGFSGPAIRAACDELDLVLAESGVWECRTEAAVDQPTIFSIAHLREPGTFDSETLDQLDTPGLLLFTQLPGPLDAAPAVDLMISVGGQLARKLGGTLCDRQRNRMTTQAMIRLRGEAAEFEYRNRQTRRGS